MLRSAIVAAGLVATGLTVTRPTMAVAQTQMVDEFKFGVLAHDVAVFDSHVETGTDVNFEMLFTPPDFLGVIGSLVGGLLGYLIFHKDATDGFLQPSGIIGSVIGAVIVLLIWTRAGGRSSMRTR